MKYLKMTWYKEEIQTLLPEYKGNAIMDPKFRTGK